MTIGNEVIIELRRRGSYGAYFSYEAYRDLSAIDSVEDLNAFFCANGVPWTCREFDRRAVVDALTRHWAELSRSRVGGTAWQLFDVTGILSLLSTLLNYRTWRSLLFRSYHPDRWRHED